MSHIASDRLSTNPARNLQFAICNLQFAICLLAASAAGAGNVAAAAESGLGRTIDQAQTKMVKLYGAGGFRGLEGYQSGFLISGEGHILTALSYVLDTDRVTVTLNDGRRYDAKLLGGDPRLEVAVLKIEATNLPHFDIAKAVSLTGGTRILAFSNLFNVAMGDEPASVQSGTVSVVTRLEGRRGVFETPYHGPIYVLDVATNNPGAAGGASDLPRRTGRHARQGAPQLAQQYLAELCRADRGASPIDRRDRGREVRLRQGVAAREEARPSHGSRSAGHQPRARRSWSGRPPMSTRSVPARPPPAPVSCPTT